MLHTFALGGVHQITHPVIVDHLGTVGPGPFRGADGRDDVVHVSHGFHECTRIAHVRAHPLIGVAEPFACAGRISRGGANDIAIRGDDFGDKRPDTPGGAEDQDPAFAVCLDSSCQSDWGQEQQRGGENPQ